MSARVAIVGCGLIGHKRADSLDGDELVGAGGGGFLLVYAQRPEDTRQAMAAAGASELPFDFEFRGAIGDESA